MNSQQTSNNFTDQIRTFEQRVKNKLSAKIELIKDQYNEKETSLFSFSKVKLFCRQKIVTYWYQDFFFYSVKSRNTYTTQSGFEFLLQ